MAHPSLPPPPRRTPNCLFLSTALGGHNEEQRGHSLIRLTSEGGREEQNRSISWAAPPLPPLATEVYQRSENLL